MKVFLSWATPDSKHIAETLREWLPQVIQNLEPWMSTHIDKGEAWDDAISEGLSDSPIGILCLTKTSIKSHYLHYEAGAIANVTGSKVCTFLYQLKNSDVKQPLGRFQHTRYEHDDVLKLLKTINDKLIERGEKGLTESQLLKSLDLNWPELVQKLDATPTTDTAIIERSERDILEEILSTVRSNNAPERDHEYWALRKDHERLLNLYRHATNIGGSDSLQNKDAIKLVKRQLRSVAYEYYKANPMTYEEAKADIDSFKKFLNSEFPSRRYSLDAIREAIDDAFLKLL